jgi:hypothetical protein
MTLQKQQTCSTLKCLETREIQRRVAYEWAGEGAKGKGVLS